MSDKTEKYIKKLAKHSRKNDIKSDDIVSKLNSLIGDKFTSKKFNPNTPYTREIEYDFINLINSIRSNKSEIPTGHKWDEILVRVTLDLINGKPFDTPVKRFTALDRLNMIPHTYWSFYYRLIYAYIAPSITLLPVSFFTELHTQGIMNPEGLAKFFDKDIIKFFFGDGKVHIACYYLKGLAINGLTEKNKLYVKWFDELDEKTKLELESFEISARHSKPKV
jgi:hypothetical protein